MFYFNSILFSILSSGRDANWFLWPKVINPLKAMSIFDKLIMWSLHESVCINGLALYHLKPRMGKVPAVTQRLSNQLKMFNYDRSICHSLTNYYYLGIYSFHCMWSLSVNWKTLFLIRSQNDQQLKLVLIMKGMMHLIRSVERIVQDNLSA